jgi:hypothetical protein
MRLVRGRTLAQVFDARRAEAAPDASWTQYVSRIVEQLAEGLHYAHQEGVLHRDVKPGNILLDQDGHPVLVDLGLAKDLGSLDASLTVDGGQLGTPAYMSAEQFSGGRLPLDQRTDVFSLALVLYEGLTLARAYDGLTLTVANGRVSRPRPVQVRRLNPHVSRDLRVVLEKAMAEDRAERYDTARAFGDDLANVRLLRPITARPASLSLRFRRWVRRSPVVAGFTLALILVLGGALGMALHFLRRAEHDAYRTNFLLAAADHEAGMTSAARKFLDACPPQLRGFEWYLLDARLRAVEEVCVLPMERPRFLVSTPESLTAVDYEGRWACYDTGAGRLRSEPGPAGGYGRAALDGAGRFVVRWHSSNGRAVERLDLGSGARASAPPVPGDAPLGDLAVERGGRVWLAPSQQPLLSWSPGDALWVARAADTAGLVGLTVSEAAGYVAGRRAGVLRLHALLGDRQLVLEPPAGWQVEAFAFAPDGASLVTASVPRKGRAALQLERWSLPEREPPAVVERSTWHLRPATAIVVADGGQVAVATEDARLVVFSPDLARQVAEHVGLEQRALALATRGAALWSVDDTRRLLRWDLESPTGETRLSARGGDAWSLCYDPSGRWLAVSNRAGLVRVLDHRGELPIAEHEVASSSSLSWDADRGGFLALGVSGLAVHVQPGADPAALFDAGALGVPPAGVDVAEERLLFWQDGVWLWCSWTAPERSPFAPWAGELELPSDADYVDAHGWLLGWDAARGFVLVDDRARESFTLPAGPAGRGRAASPDGRWVAGELASLAPDPDAGRTLVILDVAARRLLPARVPIDGQLWCVAFAPDGNLLAMGTDRRQVELVDVRTGELLLTLKTPDQVMCVAFDPRGRRLAAGCLDGSVVVWAASRAAR